MRQREPMGIRRLLVWSLSLLACLLMGNVLLASWQQPQVQSQLELRQSELSLQVLQLQDQWASADTDRQNTLAAAESSFRQRVEQLQDNSATELLVQSDRLSQALVELGLLEAVGGKPQAAIATWQNAIATALPDSANQQAAAILIGLWQDPPRLLPDAEPQLRSQLRGWFQTQALEQLYSLQQRSEALASLAQRQNRAAWQALIALLLLNGLPLIGSLLGLVLLGYLGWRRWRKQPFPPLQGWTVPWDSTVVAWVMLPGFILIGQIGLNQLLLPALLAAVGFDSSQLGVSGQAFSILVRYGLMAILVLGLLVWTIQRYRPLPPDWFVLRWRSRWALWGIGGYWVALPIVIGTSLLNQLIWQGRGGSNPLLELVLDTGSRSALFWFWVTAAIAAPLFEEVLFRGFLMASLTRWLPVRGAIALSGLLFALAHLSLSEVLPLFALGCLLGDVYARSRNLLAPMLLHGLWNSGTLISLLLLSQP
ncbi:type II CAAX endopeptidase family protein [Synechococcus elongatus]|uniref:CPBP family intramembrane glutamic endopeptidase n=2 Tax=Synechococcus elongatus TaxID=32046 RepID=UPI0030CB8435